MRIAIVVAAIFLSVLSLASAAEVQARKPTHIPAQELGSALKTLAKTRELQVLYLTQTVQGMRTQGAAGDLTAAEAFDQLLSGTGLTYRYLDESTVTIEPGPLSSKEVSNAPQAMEEAADHSLRLVQAEPGSTAASAANNPSDSSQEVIVTGSHLRGINKIPSGSLQITREDIEKVPYATVEAVIRDLPQNFGGISFDTFLAANSSTIANDNQTYRAAAIDLRGLGAQSTLTLIDGGRRAGNIQGRAVDVSAIPLAAVERIEVVTGAASSIYGSDAVGGVANIITRSRYNGLQIQSQYGAPTGLSGGERYQISAIGGHDLGRSHFVLAYDYAHESLLNIADTAYVPTNGPRGVFDTLPIQPDRDRHSAYFSGAWTMNDRLELGITGLGSFGNTEDFTLYRFPGASVDSNAINNIDTSDAGVAARATYSFNSGWQANLRAGTSRVLMQNNSSQVLNFVSGGTPFTSQSRSRVRDRSDLSYVSLVVDGGVSVLPTGIVRLAAGVEGRDEQFQYLSTNLITGAQRSAVDRSRKVGSIFGEMVVPMIGAAASGPDNILELSLSGRHDSYDDVSDSTNPQIGLLWRAAPQLTLRATYATSFRAPSLQERGGIYNLNLIAIPDPLRGGAASPVLILNGDQPAIDPETADSWSAGVDWRWQLMGETRLSVDYFQAQYDGRIDTPTPNNSGVLTTPAFEMLLNRAPTLADLQALFTPGAFGVFSNNSGSPFNLATQTIPANLIVFDDRRGNLASERLQVVDVSLNNSSERAGGELTVGLNAAYTLKHERNLTSTAPVLSIIDDAGRPPKMRARAHMGWSSSRYGIDGYANYTDSYKDTLVTPVGRVGSWTTLDLSAFLDLGAIYEQSWTRGTRISLFVENALDTDLPVLPGGAGVFGLTYDPANGSPRGRFISLRISRSW